MKATLTFPTRFEAETFAKAWSRFTFQGHVISAGMENVTVTIYGINEDRKDWINSYIQKNHS